MKENKTEIFIVIILGIIVAVLYGYIYYESKLNKHNDTPTINTSTTTTTNIKNNIIDDIKKLPKTSDESVITMNKYDFLKDKNGEYLVNIYENFKETSFQTENGLKYSLSCLEYLEDYYENTEAKTNKCVNIEIDIPKYKKKFKFYNGSDIGCHVGKDLIFTDEYVIEQSEDECTGTGSISIYNNGELIFNDKTATSEHSSDCRTIIKDNIIYYVSYSGEDYSTSEIYFKYYDLNNKKSEIIQNLGKVGE